MVKSSRMRNRATKIVGVQGAAKSAKVDLPPRPFVVVPASRFPFSST